MNRKRLITILAVIFLLLMWFLGALWINSPFLLPGPVEVVSKMLSLFSSTDFYQNLFLTIVRGLLGMAVALLFSFIIGIVAGLWPSTRYAVIPLLTTLRSTPVISVILLALIWFGSDIVPVFIALLTMFPILSSSILDGIRNLDNDLIIMARSFRVKRIRLIMGIYLPGIAPFFFNGLTNALGFGWRAIIIGEVMSQPIHGIGSRMRDAQTYLEVSSLIAWTIIAILVSSLFEITARWLENIATPWKKAEI